MSINRNATLSLWTCCLALTACLGCGGSEFPLAPVEGIVTLDGKPLANAAVRFAPQEHGDHLVGPGSLGVTDTSGRFALQTHTGHTGAVVGPHTVSISTYETRLVDPLHSDRIEVVSEERVPKRYRSPSELQLDVPASGLDQAEFNLTSK